METTVLKMLVVDDETDIEFLFRQKFRKDLKDTKVVFEFANSAEDAINFLKNRNPFDIVLVLSDINMPGMTGLELLRKIKDQFPSLKVFMVTAYGDENNYNKAKEYGADDFITKPIDFEQLREKIYNL